MKRVASCHCGSLRVTVTGVSTVVNCCHCKACQRRTGAFADPGFPPPAYSVWEETRHSWVKLPDGIQHYQRARD